LTMDGPGLRFFPGAGLFMASSLATLTPCKSHFPAGARSFLLPLIPRYGPSVRSGHATAGNDARPDIAMRFFGVTLQMVSGSNSWLALSAIARLSNGLNQRACWKRSIEEFSARS